MTKKTDKLITWMTIDGRPAIETCRFDDGTVRFQFHPEKGKPWIRVTTLPETDPRIGHSDGMDFHND